MLERFCEEVILQALKQDAPQGDITTRLLGLDNLKLTGVLYPRQSCTLAGVPCAVKAFQMAGARATPGEGIRDGMEVEEGRIILNVEGRAHQVLLAERTALNLISHLSGIATATRELLRRAREANPKVVVAATRKVTPTLGYLEKMAVMAAGGSPHRYTLSDMILIKDNHLAALGGGPEAVKEALRRVRSLDPFHRIDVEVGNLQEAVAASIAGADIIMLDNFSPEEAKRAYREVKGRNRGVLIEISGGITPENVAEYAPYADIISSGYITHSAPAVDFTLEIR